MRRQANAKRKKTNGSSSQAAGTELQRYSGMDRARDHYGEDIPAPLLLKDTHTLTTSADTTLM